MFRLSIYTLTLFAMCCGALSIPCEAGAKDTGKYDVSYLWHADLQKVLAYKDSVSRVLGSDLKDKLLVVRKVVIAKERRVFLTGMSAQVWRILQTLDLDQLFNAADQTSHYSD